MNAISKVIRESLESLIREKVRISMLLVISLLLMIIGFGIELKSENTDFLLNLAANFIGAIMIFLILDNGIERIRKLSFFDIREHSRFPVNTFLDNINTSKKQVKMLDIWMYSLVINDNNWPELQRSIKNAVKNGVTIHVLCVAPESDAAKKRAMELKGHYNFDVINEIRKCLSRLYFLKNEMETDNLYNRDTPLFEVRLYNDLPSISMYLWDNSAYWSFYPSNKLSSQSPHLEISVDNSLGKYLSVKFHELWSDQETVILNTHHYCE